MTQAIKTISIERQELHETSTAAISEGIQIGIEQAGAIVDQFEYAELSGKRTHGFVRVPWLVTQPLSGHRPLAIEHDNDPVTYVDCSQSVGYLAATEITAYIGNQLRERPIQTVVAKDIFPTNTLGFHVRELLINDDAIGLIFGTTPNLVAGPGMDSKILGTNPLAIGLAHNGIETVADITTASASLGELLAAKYWGGFDGSHFRTSTNAMPEEARDLYHDGKFTGSIVPKLESRAEQRLYALNMMLQMVTGLVADTPGGRGNLVVVGMNKAFFNNAVMTSLVDPKLLPGSRSHTRYLESKHDSHIEVPAALWREIQALPA